MHEREDSGRWNVYVTRPDLSIPRLVRCPTLCCDVAEFVCFHTYIRSPPHIDTHHRQSRVENKRCHSMVLTLSDGIVMFRTTQRGIAISCKSFKAASVNE